MTESEATLNDETCDDDQQLIKLCLKKPKKYNWELTTSKSSSNIAFPTIQLYDEHNKTMLAEAHDAGFVASSKLLKLSKSASVSRASSMRSVKKIDSFKISLKEQEEDIEEPIITEPDEKHHRKSRHDYERSPAPVQVFSERGILLRDANSKEFRKPSEKRERTKAYSRSSSNSMRSRSSVSILERISELKRDSSSSDESDDDKSAASRTKNNKKYSFRTCNVGTIIVPKESFSKARRRPKRNDEFCDKVTTLKSNSSANLRQHSPRIIDSQDIENVKSTSQSYIEETKAVNPSADEVFLLLVKRLASSLQYNSQQIPQDNLKSLVSPAKSNSTRSSYQTISNCRAERDPTDNNRSKTDGADYDEVDFQSPSDCNYLDRINEQHNNNKPSRIQRNNMGSNVSTSGKGLSGRRTQSSSNIDTNKSSITNGICCSTKYAKSGRKNSNHSQQQDFDKKPLNNNNNNEHFDGIDQIIATTTTTGTLKPKKSSSQSKSKDRKKMHGSLPNHLDTDVDYEGSDDTNSSAYGNRVKFQPVSKIITQNPPVQVIDQCYDQGYGSERSPEDEMPPPLPIVGGDPYNQMIVSSVMMPHSMIVNTNQMMDMELHQRLQQQQATQPNYDFITEDCTFNVEIIKGPRGLGLSVSGGIDSSAPYPGLVRIKRLFPHQAAWSTGKLQPGDILLEANGIILTGLTNNEALEVLRTMANVVNLLVCRPHDEHFRKLSPPTAEPPVPPMRSSFNFKHQQYMNPLESILPPGEFEIILIKQQGSLGFTLQKEDESVFGHHVRALVREPATTDGRINAGDKIIAVNDVPISNMTHEQAVIFLRQSPDTVKLRLYRDDGQTPSSSTMSPSDSDYKSYAGINTLTKRTKMNLRPEAINLLTDLASKKNTQSSSDGNSAGSSFQSSPNTTSSPRNRLRKNFKCSISSAPDSDTNNSSDSTLKSNCSIGNNHTYIISENTSSGTMTPYSDSSADTQTVISQQNRMQYYDPLELVHIAPDDDDNEGYYDSDELEKLEQDGDSPDGRLKRPEFLNLSSQSGSTPVVCRKPFQFSIATANAYELNNLDNAILDAPTSYKMGFFDGNHDNDHDDGPNNFTSLPCETLLLACKTEEDLKKSPNDDDIDTCLYVTKFNKQNPMYQSAQVQISHNNKHSIMASDRLDGDGATEMNMLKWKGVTMSQHDDGDDDKCSVASSRYDDPPSTSQNSLHRISVRNAQKDLNMDEMGIDGKEYRIITIEMNRRWSCRLGIRLESQLAPNDPNKSITVIKEICKDTLAERDGRLVPGDRVLMINDEIVDDRNTHEIIEMMRIIRGPLCVTIARKIEP